MSSRPRSLLRSRLLAGAVSVVAATLSAQEPAPRRTLLDVQRAFAAQQQQLYAGDKTPTRDEELAMLRRQVEELSGFVDREAQGDDRWNGRLMLADMSMALRDAARAEKALRAIDPQTAPALILLLAADMAAHLQLQPLRDELVQKALARESSLEERMAMARVLMTLLREVAAGEKIFADALAAAGDDEQRALVRWHQADALREREDLPENSYYDALDKLAKDLPGTRYGSIAKDRCTASQFTIGADSIPFTVTTTEGTRVESAALRGRAVLLAFWSAADPRRKELVDALQAMQREQKDQLFLLGISVDPDPAEFARACRELGVTFLQVCDGKGPQTDLALRYLVETWPTLIVIDRQGRIAGLNLHVDTRDARDELQAALRRALGR